MRIAVDIDGVVAEFAEPCNAWLASALGVERVPIVRWDWYYDYGHPMGSRVWKKFWEFASDTEFFNNLPIIPGAKQGVDALLDQGHDVRFVTARDPHNYGRQTREWLSRHRLPVDVVHTERKHDWVDKFDLLVDDAPHHLRAWRREGGNAYVFKQPWNRELASWASVSNWDALVSRMANYAVQ